VAARVSGVDRRGARAIRILHPQKNRRSHTSLQSSRRFGCSSRRAPCRSTARRGVSSGSAGLNGLSRPCAWSSPPRRHQLVSREISFTCNALDSVVLVRRLDVGKPHGFAGELIDVSRGQRRRFGLLGHAGEYRPRAMFLQQPPPRQAYLGRFICPGLALFAGGAGYGLRPLAAGGLLRLSCFLLAMSISS
jgi:hypothetical protein